LQILFLHGWRSVPGGVKPTFLKEHGHIIINPALSDDDFEDAVRTAQAEYDRHRPEVVVGSSRGGAVAMNINSGDAKLVLLCPAWRNWGTAKKVRPDTAILHSRGDDVIPFADSEELARNSGATLIEIGTDHRLAEPQPLAAMLSECESIAPKLMGCDFGAPKKAGDQAKKIIAIEATEIGPKHYAVRKGGRNQRLADWHPGLRKWPYDRSGWTLAALRDSLYADASLRIGAFDFPFSLPSSLLSMPEFAQRMDYPAAFGNRKQWAEFVAARLPFTFTNDTASGEMTGFAQFKPWRDKTLWLRRACDIAARGSPPLKHVGQNLFSMTLAGAALLQAVEPAGYFIMLGDRPAGERRVLFETYPSLIARRIGFIGSYKTESARCLNAALAFLERQDIRLDFAVEVRKFCETYRTGATRDDPDGADAFLCLVAAICFREGLTEVVSGDATPAQLAEEGGIVAPRVFG
jgi:hypothetical protein